ncbi:hypothetical protein [Rhizomonospora bruguierae]|uniref:hypothetical protein n=1 Tax=Rhizomonospora bruguierae TaxID=1581705 RepID=UPI001BD16CC6|nr:hypothetical protein [Micromonospora sp. NBRC 107566]
MAGGTGDPVGSAREEAERLVAAALAAATVAARGLGRRGGGSALLDGLFGAPHREYRVANDSPDCCVCPVCRLIAAMRDPGPEVAERLATGAGDLAAGVASLLRALAPEPPAEDRAWKPAGKQAAEPARKPGGEPAGKAGGEPAGRAGAAGVESDTVWRAATRGPQPPVARPAPDPETDPWAAATAAGAAGAVGAAGPAGTASEVGAADIAGAATELGAGAAAAEPPRPAAAKKVAKKAVAKKAVAKKVAKKAVRAVPPEPPVDDDLGGGTG